MQILIFFLFLLPFECKVGLIYILDSIDTDLSAEQQKIYLWLCISDTVQFYSPWEFFLLLEFWRVHLKKTNHPCYHGKYLNLNPEEIFVQSLTFKFKK